MYIFKTEVYWSAPWIPSFLHELSYSLHKHLSYYVSVKTPKYTEWCSSCTHRAYSCGRLKAMTKILCNATQQKEKSISPSLDSWQACNYLWPIEWERKWVLNAGFKRPCNNNILALLEHCCHVTKSGVAHWRMRDQVEPRGQVWAEAPSEQTAAAEQPEDFGHQQSQTRADDLDSPRNGEK